LSKTIDDFIVHLFTDCIFRLLVVIGHPTPTSGVQPPITMCFLSLLSGDTIVQEPPMKSEWQ